MQPMYYTQEMLDDVGEVANTIIPIDAIEPHPANYNEHPDAQIRDLIASDKRFNQIRSIVVQQGAPGHYLLVAGHGYTVARKAAGRKWIKADVIPASWSKDQVIGYLVADNELARKSITNDALLAELLQAQADQGYDLTTVGSSQEDLDALLDQLALEALAAGDEDAADQDTGVKGSLADRFLVPPFTVLDARQGYWQDRKRLWLALGIQSELGRGADAEGDGLLGISAEARSHFKAGSGPTSMGKNLAGRLPKRPNAASYKGQASLNAIQRGKAVQAVDGGLLMTSHSGNDPEYYFKKQRAEARLGRKLTTKEFQRDYYDGPGSYQSGTSIFDPVLCELAYSWFSPPGGTVLDPFAGGSVRGIVAAKLGREYHGIELRGEKVAANVVQAETILQMPQTDAIKHGDDDEAVPTDATDGEAVPPTWYTGDSVQMDTILPASLTADLVFTCPPYFDLEVYSNEPGDLSALQSYEEFLAAYRAIAAASIARLKPDRFAVVVVGDIRDKRGIYRNFVSDTIAAYQSAGAMLYNEAILVTVVGSLPVRSGKIFQTSRKLGKTHQNVLVFVKGDPNRAALACGEVVIMDEDDFQENPPDGQGDDR